MRAIAIATNLSILLCGAAQAGTVQFDLSPAMNRDYFGFDVPTHGQSGGATAEQRQTTLILGRTSTHYSDDDDNIPLDGVVADPVHGDSFQLVTADGGRDVAVLNSIGVTAAQGNAPLVDFNLAENGYYSRITVLYTDNGTFQFATPDVAAEIRAVYTDGSEDGFAWDLFTSGAGGTFGEDMRLVLQNVGGMSDAVPGPSFSRRVDLDRFKLGAQDLMLDDTKVLDRLIFDIAGVEDDNLNFMGEMRVLAINGLEGSGPPPSVIPVPAALALLLPALAVLRRR